jgi:hypothetical protein
MQLPAGCRHLPRLTCGSCNSFLIPILLDDIWSWTNTDVDLTVTSDHRIRHASLELEDGLGVLVSDLANMTRYLANRGTMLLLCCTIYWSIIRKH